MCKSVFFLFLIISVSFFSCKRDTACNDLELENIKGKVYILTETYFDFKIPNGKFDEGFISKILIKTYDKSGNLLEVADCFPDGEIQFKETFEYNKLGKLAMSKKKYKEEELWKEVYFYNSKEELIEVNMYQKGVLSMREFYENDEHRNLKMLEAYFSDGSFAYSLKNKYDDQNRKIEENNSSLVFIKKLEYDGESNIIAKEKYYKEDGGDSTRNGLEEREVIDYDDNKNCIKSIVFQYGQYRHNDTFDYDYQNFDGNGNWLKKSEKKNNQPKQIIERKIEYYD